MSLPALPSCWQVYFVGMFPLLANAVLLSVKPGGVPPANFSRPITLSMTFGEPPVLSLFVLDSHRPPSGDLTTLRNRPQPPFDDARRVAGPVPPSVVGAVQRTAP